MFRNYRPLWWLLLTALLIFGIIELAGPLTVGDHELKQTRLVATLTEAKAQTPALKTAFAGDDTRTPAKDAPRSETVTAADGSAASDGSAGADYGSPFTDGAQFAHRALDVPCDTAAKTILFIGDSMLDGLSPRLAAYAKANGHTLYSVIWYSSTSEVWGRSDKLRSYISRLNPDFIFICLGANELNVRDIADKRARYVKKMVSAIGSIPFVWIGPPNWKEDTGINDLIASNVPQGSYFRSNGMHFERKKDGAHPTQASSALWMDSVARWMPRYASHPIAMDCPSENTARPKRVFVHQPNEK